MLGKRICRIQMIPRTKKTKGQSLVEFAMFIVIMLIILAGIVDIVRMVTTWITMRDAAQEGASFGSVYPTYCLQIADRATNNLIDPENYTVTVLIDNVTCSSASSAQACLGHLVTVNVTQPHFSLSMPFIGAFLGGQTFNLTATSNDTIIRTPCH
jgi:Flp pilus assembly protein TadG